MVERRGVEGAEDKARGSRRKGQMEEKPRIERWRRRDTKERFSFSAGTGACLYFGELAGKCFVHPGIKSRHSSAPLLRDLDLLLLVYSAPSLARRLDPSEEKSRS